MRFLRRAMRSVLSLLTLTTIHPRLALGQSASLQLYPQRGVTATGTYAHGDPDFISPPSGTLSMKIPLVNFAPNSRAGFELSLLYDSGIYDISVEPGTDTAGNTISLNRLHPSALGGWRYNFKNLDLQLKTRHLTSSCGGASEIAKSERLWNLAVGTLDGATHVLTPRGFADEIGDSHIDDGFYGVYLFGQTNNCPGVSPPHYTSSGYNDIYYYSTDSSFVQLRLNNRDNPQTQGADLGWTLYNRDGSRVEALQQPGWERTLYDPNGNAITIRNYCGATCGTLAYTRLANADEDYLTLTYNDQPGRDQIRTTSPDGGFHDAYVYWKYISVQSGNTNYTCGYSAVGANPIACSAAQTLRVIDKITYPGSTTPMSFEYNAGTSGWGELSAVNNPFRVTTSTGSARLEWQWENGAKSDPNSLLKNRVTKRTLAHDGMADIWGYNYISNTQTNITFPYGGSSVTKYHFYDPAVLSNWNRGLVHKIEYPTGDVTVRSWQQNPVRGLGQRSLTTSPNNPFVASESYQPAGASTSNAAVTGYLQDKNGNTTEAAWSSFGLAAPLRRIGWTYAGGAASSSTIIPLVGGDAQEVLTYTWPFSGAVRKLNWMTKETQSGQSGTESVREYYYTGVNVTEERSWNSNVLSTPPAGVMTAGQYISKTWAFDAFGRLERTGGAQLAIKHTYGFPACGSVPRNLLLKTELAHGTGDQLSVSREWDCWSGFLKAEKNDGQWQTRYTYDVRNRVRIRNDFGLRQRTWNYTEDGATVSAGSDLKALGDGLLQTKIRLDDLGRVRLTQSRDDTALGENETDGIKVRTIYKTANDGGAIQIVSNPHRTTGDSTMGWTCTQSDAGGFVNLISRFSGAVEPALCNDTSNRVAVAAATRYFDAASKAVVHARMDADGNLREEYLDFLGRTVKIVEHAGASLETTYETSYSYDSRDNVVGVAQGSQPARSFTYDSIGRLKTAVNPESGTIGYEYYDDGTLKRRTDARGKSVDYTYDDMKRPLTKAFDGSTTAAVTYSYYKAAGASEISQAGRLKSMTGAGASSQFDYDLFGNITHTKQTIGSRSYELYAGYFLNDALGALAYPSGRIISFPVDDAGRATGVDDAAKLPIVPIAESGKYSPAGMQSELKIGAVRQRWSYGDRMQLTKLEVGTGAASTPGAYDRFLMSQSYSGVGNVLTQTFARNGGGSTLQNFRYDGVGRLAKAWETGQSEVWRQTYAYDRWGNRWLNDSCDRQSTDPLCNHGLPIDPSTPRTQGAYNTINNRLSSTELFGFDGAGNQTKLGPFTVEYDSEGRMTKSSLDAAYSCEFDQRFC